MVVLNDAGGNLFGYDGNKYSITDNRNKLFEQERSWGGPILPAAQHKFWPINPMPNIRAQQLSFVSNSVEIAK